jgi:hypothetical protein
LAMNTDYPTMPKSSVETLSKLKKGLKILKLNSKLRSFNNMHTNLAMFVPKRIFFLKL